MAVADPSVDEELGKDDPGESEEGDPTCGDSAACCWCCADEEIE